MTTTRTYTISNIDGTRRRGGGGVVSALSALSALANHVSDDPDTDGGLVGWVPDRDAARRAVAVLTAAGLSASWAPDADADGAWVYAVEAVTGPRAVREVAS